MWCHRCQRTTSSRSDTSATTTRCAQCGGPLSEVRSGNDAVRRAQEILNRWQSSELLEQIEATEKIPPFDWTSKVNAVVGDRRKTNPVPESSASAVAAPQPTTPAKTPAKSTSTSPVTPPHTDPPAVEPQEANTGQVPAETESSAEIPADIKSETTTDPEMKPDEQQPPARPQPRVPMHRRVRPVNPAPAPFSGTPIVKKKLRVDLPVGSTQETSEQRSSQAEGKQSPVIANEQTEAGDVAAAPAAHDSADSIVSNAESARPSRRFRIDSAQSVQQLSGADHDRSRGFGLPKHRYIDEPHSSGPAGPHFQVTAPRRSNLTSMTGQFLAYIGVLGLTIGTAIVIYGHFGGGSQYTPTGWLVTTVAQMLLFLGVINLVSGGIEQNNDEVSRRINTLGEQLLRIELVTEQALRGPKIPASRFMNPATEDSQPIREAADVRKS